MNVYFIFGYTGVGKSYVGNLLKQQGVDYLEGDDYITPIMKEYLDEGLQLNQAMIVDFTKILIREIKAFQQHHPHKTLVVSQAMYLNECRLLLLNEVPGLKFIWLKSVTKSRHNIIKKRFQDKNSKVTQDYAVEMDNFFQHPTHDYLDLWNSYHPQESNELLQALSKMMPEAFIDNEVEDLKKVDRPPTQAGFSLS